MCLDTPVKHSWNIIFSIFPLLIMITARNNCLLSDLYVDEHSLIQHKHEYVVKFDISQSLIGLMKSAGNMQIYDMMGVIMTIVLHFSLMYSRLLFLQELPPFVSLYGQFWGSTSMTPGRTPLLTLDRTHRKGRHACRLFAMFKVCKAQHSVSEDLMIDFLLR